jgi:hypothetical protein
MVEAELIFAFQRLLSQEPYGRIRGTSFEEKINAAIVRELERQGSIHFDAAVLRALWLG